MKFFPDGRRGSDSVVRACVTPIPRGWGAITILPVLDPVAWNVDGYDT